ncbi:polysaccharide deacetylase family protein [Oscillospiraceae bacterium HV4-5-C5C]|nr:polysaccharide deacetylase family protein [Oscillospiraceae bacterium HV4-5-C5C]
MITFDRFEQGRRHILTMSYDDGVAADRRLVEVLNRYGIRGTFHLNSGTLDTPEHIRSEEVAALYQGHEVAVHTVHHPHLEALPGTAVLSEILQDRQNLENLCAYPVRGMSYPFGSYREETLQALRLCGIEYSRTTQATHAFALPENFLEWHPTCHHNDHLLELAERFQKDLKRPWCSDCFYVWGHAYEFDNEDNWGLMEAFCAQLSGLPDVWYATSIEIVDYIRAQRSLKISVDESIVSNPSARTLWFAKDGETVAIRAGETLKL